MIPQSLCLGCCLRVQIIFCHVESLTVYCAIVQFDAIDKTQDYRKPCICDITCGPTDHFPMAISEALHLPQLKIISPSFYAFILLLEKGGEMA